MSAASEPLHAIERSVLAMVMFTPDTLFDVREILSAEDFTDPRHAALFQACCEIDDSRGGVSPDTAAAVLEKRADIYPPRVDLSWLAWIVTDVEANARPSLAHLSHHLRVLSEAAALRRTSRACREGIAEIEDARPGLDEAWPCIDRLEAAVYAAADRQGPRSTSISAGDAAAQVLAELDQPVRTAGLQTGLYALDALLHGLRPGDLALIAGRPGKGKSAFALQVLINAARDGASGLMLSLEMSAQDISARALSNLSGSPGVSGASIRARAIGPNDREKLRSAKAELDRLPLEWIEESGTTLPRLRGRARRHAHRKGLDLLVVDYVQLMHDPKAKDRYHEVSAISRGLKELAHELRVPLIALCQLNRAVGDERPRLHHLRESGQLEQDADQAVLLWSGDEASSDLECDLAKNRHGPTGTFRLAFNRANSRIGESDPLALVAEDMRTAPHPSAVSRAAKAASECVLILAMGLMLGCLWRGLSPRTAEPVAIAAREIVRSIQEIPDNPSHSLAFLLAELDQRYPDLSR